MFKGSLRVSYRERRFALFSLFLAGALLASGCGKGSEKTALANQPQTDAGASPATQAENAATPIQSNQPAETRIPSGTAISIRLLSNIGSGFSQPGDQVDAELASPLVVEGQTVFDRGTPARVRVVAAEPSGRLQHPGFLRITLDSIKGPSGNWIHLGTAALSEKGKSHEKRDATIIGGVAAVGATIGAIAGGGKGAAIGALSGAGAGTAGAYATGKKDVGYSAESVLRFRTTSEIILGQ